jgi:hypothetical protein
MEHYPATLTRGHRLRTHVLYRLSRTAHERDMTPRAMTAVVVPSAQGRRGLVPLGKRGPGLRRVDLDDLVSHGPEQAE